jgi:hypothetical protein
MLYFSAELILAVVAEGDATSSYTEKGYFF